MPITDSSQGITKNSRGFVTTGVRLTASGDVGRLRVLFVTCLLLLLACSARMTLLQFCYGVVRAERQAQQRQFGDMRDSQSSFHVVHGVSRVPMRRNALLQQGNTSASWLDKNAARAAYHFTVSCLCMDQDRLVGGEGLHVCV